MSINFTTSYYLPSFLPSSLSLYTSLYHFLPSFLSSLLLFQFFLFLNGVSSPNNDFSNDPPTHPPRTILFFTKIKLFTIFFCLYLYNLSLTFSGFHPSPYPLFFYLNNEKKINYSNYYYSLQ